MNLNTADTPRPGSRPAMLLALLDDRVEHSSTEIRTRLGMTKGILSSALYCLRYKYGYVIETHTHDDHCGFQLIERLIAHRVVPRYPELGSELRVGGLNLVDGKIMVECSDPSGQAWTLVMASP